VIGYHYNDTYCFSTLVLGVGIKPFEY